MAPVDRPPWTAEEVLRQADWARLSPDSRNYDNGTSGIEPNDRGALLWTFELTVAELLYDGRLGEADARVWRGAYHPRPPLRAPRASFDQSYPTLRASRRRVAGLIAAHLSKATTTPHPKMLAALGRHLRDSKVDERTGVVGRTSAERRQASRRRARARLAEHNAAIGLVSQILDATSGEPTRLRLSIDAVVTSVRQGISADCVESFSQLYTVLNEAGEPLAAAAAWNAALAADGQPFARAEMLGNCATNLARDRQQEAALQVLRLRPSLPTREPRDEARLLEQEIMVRFATRDACDADVLRRTYRSVAALWARARTT